MTLKNKRNLIRGDETPFLDSCVLISLQNYKKIFKWQIFGRINLEKAEKTSIDYDNRQRFSLVDLQHHRQTDLRTGLQFGQLFPRLFVNGVGGAGVGQGVA